ncbi:DNA internalization-related competence protein ComEC/Rec2 [Paraburkholderia megapolitana]|uniref:Competence protein ComEC n=1 Tax=Paraburkholderia megapolitana TaxID=420953 RepID=A0A1I3NK41_9BURK|nr:DNA internalization-related competence protein ComEC/Rec2 [Paraburkholderia megapolitana]QDQ84410.1 DNA internalization-related competence protein ComEC/Rec2 [Paraburkholderia megapolitana]SFJ09683.1 competence protein ComEC [Paraburkholderia megapolitana]
MRAVWCGFVLGVIGLQQQAALPSMMGWCVLALAWLLGVAVAVKAWTIVRRRARVSVDARRWAHAGWGALIFAAACSGFGYAAWRAELRLAVALPAAWESRDIEVSGYVVGLPSRDKIASRFLFEVESASAPIVRFPKTIQLVWVARDTPPPVLEPGSRWRLPVRLKRSHSTANFGVRDGEATLLARNVRATGYVSVPEHALLLAGNASGIGVTINRWRAAIRARIDVVLADAPHRGIVIALAIGAQDAVSTADWASMRNTGTNHLIAISGLHIGLVAGFAAWFAGSLWRRSAFVGRYWPLRVPAQKIAALGGALFAVFHAALAGFNVPAQRALWMLAIAALAFVGGRRLASSVVFAWALGLVLLTDPWAVLSPGFWLSFCAVAAILFAVSGPRRRVRLPHDPDAAPVHPLRRAWQRCSNAFARYVHDSTHIQLAVTIALAPLTLYWFSQIPLIGPVANAFAIPWMSLLVTPVVLAGAVLPMPLDAWAFQVADGLLRIQSVVLHWLATPTWAVWHLPRPGPWALVCATAGVAWCLAPRGWPLRWAGPIAWLPLLLPPPSGPPHGAFRLTALDIGQGNSVLVETAHHALLFDAGPGPESTHAGERVVVPFLQAQGVTALDALMVSHEDSDHAGGAPAVLDGVEVRQLLASLPQRHALWAQARKVGAERVQCAAGQRWQWDGVDFTILWPDERRLRANPNDQCCVLRIRTAGRTGHAGHGYAANPTPALTALLAADIEAPIERTLLARDPDALRAQVLLVPHHGSRTSSTEPFLDTIDPLIAIFQVGYRNRFRHPHPGVFARYEARHIELTRSDTDGAVRIEASGTTLSLERYRDTHRRYWMDR